jgi:hypothetical protein
MACGVVKPMPGSGAGVRVISEHRYLAARDSAATIAWQVWLESIPKCIPATHAVVRALFLRGALQQTARRFRSSQGLHRACTSDSRF